ncbi:MULTISPECIES: glycerophosphodiester phosphodiesterase [Pontibacillus]|uniref:Glycerophosphodiester phosphodiesterase n=1 Tax=Pontibacillus chungwhensis TaxID=265426 RepID=A0ABY8UUQ4_9BACI|nr:glycerophosphodiester phosphodiesterase [Pontibacillus chungwhensis]MCD5323090.1 glycerophosphodiester phosphodiesterase [Pontibacillus sp. HN14]WIF96481.1 glycerophosphodiester phosphodiesterase [Pontibacillus chungwhensis]
MKTFIFAHRGASRLAPENTMAAFILAQKMGADGVETDVQLTKDHIPVLIHDETLHRTTDGTGYVKDYTFEELKRLDAGSWFSEKYKGEQLLSLEEFLQWIASTNLVMNIELKNNLIDYKDIEQKVFNLITHYKLEHRTIISSFNPKSIRRFRRISKEIECACLTSRRPKDLQQLIQDSKANALHIKYTALTKGLLKEADRLQLPVRTYTINRPSRLMRSYKLNLDGIFTDVPHSAIEYKELYLHKHKS